MLRLAIPAGLSAISATGQKVHRLGVPERIDAGVCWAPGAAMFKDEWKGWLLVSLGPVALGFVMAVIAAIYLYLQHRL